VSEDRLQQLTDQKLRERMDAVAADSVHQYLKSHFDTDVRARIDRAFSDAITRFDAHADRHTRQIDAQRFAWSPSFMTSASYHASEHNTPAWASYAQTPVAVSTEKPMVPVINKTISQVLTATYGSKGHHKQQERVNMETGTMNARALLAERQQSHDHKAFVNHARTKDKHPRLLDTVRVGAIKQFVLQYQRYRNHGGPEKWTSFVAPAVNEYLQSVECPLNYSETQIYDHLVEKANEGNSDVVLLENNFAKVGVDPQAVTSREKAESILVGVESVLVEMAVLMPMDKAEPPQIPLVTVIEIVLTKVPRELRESVERRMKFAPAPTSKREFAKLLLD
jgi:hypothetical protein